MAPDYLLPWLKMAEAHLWRAAAQVRAGRSSRDAADAGLRALEQAPRGSAPMAGPTLRALLQKLRAGDAPAAITDVPIY
jgi:hypothetical protein